MATKKRLGRRDDPNSLTEDMLIFLINGIPWFTDPTDVEAEKAWQRHKRYVMAQNDSNGSGFTNYRAGTRPWAWWKFDRGKPRDLGEPTGSKECFHGCQMRYLKRHGLLFEGEA